MKRKIEIAAACLLTLLGITAIIITRTGREAVPAAPPISAPTVSPEGPIIIRNLTDRPVAFEVRPFGSLQPPAKRILKAREIGKFAARKELSITYQKRGTEITERLFPGSAYCFRFDENDWVQLYLGSHMREDAEDLAPYVPTPDEVAAKMLEMARVTRSDVVYDLGCGDGRIVIAAAKKFGAHGVGVDIDPQRIREAEEAAEGAGVKGLVEFRVEDAMKTDLSAATVVTLYLLPESNALLRPRFEKQLKPGARVVTHNYSVPGWQNREIDYATIEDQSGRRHSVFVYRSTAD